MNGRQRRCSHLSQSRLMFFLPRLTPTSSLSAIDSAIPPNCRIDWDCIPSVRARRTNWPAGCLPHAIEDDRLAHLSGLVMEECRQRRIVVPLPGTLERLCIGVRYQARREVQRRLTEGLSADQRHRLDALTQHRGESGQSWLAWLRQMPEATKPLAMLGLIERLVHVRSF